MDNENQATTSLYFEEAGRGYRLKKKQIDPIVCPVCGITLRNSEVEMHLTCEIEKLNKIPPSRPRSNWKNTSSSSSNGGSPKSPSNSDKDKKWEIFQKVRANRQSRQRMKSRKRKTEEVVCPICNKDVSSMAEDLVIHVENCLRRSESVSETEDNNEAIDVEAFEEYEWAGQSRIRATSLLQGGVSCLGSSLSMAEDDEDLNVVDDGRVYGDAQYSECDVISPCDDEGNHALRQAIIGDDSKTANSVVEENSRYSNEVACFSTNTKCSDPVLETLKARVCELESRGNNYKCLICMDRYHTPVISVCCWHVHCEQCWLQTLGVKKLCPQCNMITSPSDLRRIYM